CVTVVIVVCAGFHRILHSFPTRRSSDLARQQLVCAALIMDLAMRWRDDDVTASSSRFNQALDLWFAARVQLNALTTGERRIAPNITASIDPVVTARRALKVPGFNAGNQCIEAGR